MVVLIIFPVILQTVINVIMLSIGRQWAYKLLAEVVNEYIVDNNIVLAIFLPKIIKVGENLTKLCRKQFWLFFWDMVYYIKPQLQLHNWKI